MEGGREGGRERGGMEEDGKGEAGGLASQSYG